MSSNPARPEIAVPYSIQKTLWKGLRPALIVAVTAFGAALAQNVDPSTLTAVGVPSFVAVFGIEGARNYFKNRNK